jgi:phosphatidylinositol alpha-1,6-mannosyltransferase
VPLEAMASGRPVLATGAGGSAEFLRHGENCLLFSPREDPRALAAAVERLAGDAALRARLREGGFATAERIDQRAFERAVGRLLDQAAAGDWRR